MKLAIHNWMRAEPLETTVKRISDMGYDYIEIMGEPSMYPIESTRELLDSHGIKCYGSVTLMLEKRNLLAKDPSERAMSVQYVKDVVSMVHGLGGEMVSVVPGTVGKVVADAHQDQEWEWAVQGMKEINDFARDHGVKIGIEPINRFETYFINRADQALALAEATAPDCGVCLDIFHMNIEEDDVWEAIRRTGSRLVNMHVADNNRMAPGMGTLDFGKLVSVLGEIGYDKVLSVEFCSPIDRTPANPYPNSLEDDPVGLSPEARKFLEDHGSTSVTEEFYNMLTQRSFDTLKPIITQ